MADSACVNRRGSSMPEHVLTVESWPLPIWTHLWICDTPAFVGIFEVYVFHEPEKLLIIKSFKSRTQRLKGPYNYIEIQNLHQVQESLLDGLESTEHIVYLNSNDYIL